MPDFRQVGVPTYSVSWDCSQHPSDKWGITHNWDRSWINSRNTNRHSLSTNELSSSERKNAGRKILTHDLIQKLISSSISSSISLSNGSNNNNQHDDLEWDGSKLPRVLRKASIALLPCFFSSSVMSKRFANHSSALFTRSMKSRLPSSDLPYHKYGLAWLGHRLNR